VRNRTGSPMISIAAIRSPSKTNRITRRRRPFGASTSPGWPSRSTAGTPAIVAAWRNAPFFTDAERAALALTESVTRLSDREDPVPDSVWHEAVRHYDEPARAALLLSIASINVWNRLNVSTRQIAGAAW
jgi:hypothetical protein